MMNLEAKLGHGKKEKIERGNWVSKTEFLLSCLGYAIGIGNVWRFPYLCYRNGGGAFLVPYLLMLFLCGLPLFYLETSIGQFSSLGCITMFRIAPLFKGAGYATIVINIICTAYYSLILTYPLMFIKNSFGATLPWEDCNHSWNTDNCLKISGTEELIGNFTKNSTIKTPSDEFFHNHVLVISESINELGSIVWELFWGNMFAWAVMFACIAKGVKSVGKVVYFTATFPFFILIVLFVRGITLPGAMDGIYFYIYPQWHQLLNLRVWADAAIQIFYSLGPGWGGIVNMASYNKFNNDNLSDSIIVPIVNCGTSIFAGFTVFSVIGFMSHRTGLAIEDVASAGPSLAFVTYPAAITMLPWSNLWAVLFFAMLFFLGIDSCFVQLEAVISALLDECPSLMKWKTSVTFLSCVLFFGLSIICTTNAGMYIVQLMDWYCASIGIIMICLIEIIIVGWTYGYDNFTRDIQFMNGHKVHWIWKVCWKYITPTILTFIFITTIIWNRDLTYLDEPYPSWSIKLGWCMCLSSMICIPVYMLYFLTFCTEGNLLERIKFSLRPDTKWGPANSIVAEEWKQRVNNVIPLEVYLDSNKNI